MDDTPMRNITGNAVEGTDYFNRPKILSDLLRELENEANILLTAPRRVGKTSVALKLCEEFKKNHRVAIQFNVEGCGDELAFAEKLIEALEQNNLHPELMNRLGLGFRRIRQALKGMRFKAGIDVDLGKDEAEDSRTLARAIENVFQKIEAEKRTILIVIDELPELLLALTREDPESDRAERFLHWLRELRQTYRKHIRWVFLGSIGLDSFVEGRSLGKTINDLVPKTLPALSPEEADRFLETLGQDNKLPLSREARAAIIERVGWLLPHHLQVVFHALRETEIRSIDEDAIGQAFNHLLRPENLFFFDTWRQRLNDQFTKPEQRAVLLILNRLCTQPGGLTREGIFDTLMAASPAASPDEAREDLSRLLLLLQRDGYLMETNGRYGFRSFLLREYWYRREVK